MSAIATSRGAQKMGGHGGIIGYFGTSYPTAARFPEHRQEDSQYVCGIAMFQYDCRGIQAVNMVQIK